MRWKDKISRFWIFPAERQLCLAGRKRLLEGKMQLAGSKEGGCVILNTPRGSSKMEIPANNFSHVCFATHKSSRMDVGEGGIP